MFVLLGGGNYRIFALLWILIFDFYMILCSRQIIYLNNLPVVNISFDRRTSILHSWDLSKCWIHWPFRKVNIYYDFLVGEKDILCAKLSNEDVGFTPSRLVLAHSLQRVPCAKAFARILKLDT